MSHCFQDHADGPATKRFRLFDEKTWEHVFRFVLGLLGDEDLAEEVTQGIFLKVKEDRFSPGSTPSGLEILAHVARKIADTFLYSRLRERARRKDQDIDSVPKSPSEKALDDALDILQAIDDLPEPLRECVILKDRGRLPPGHIAKRLGIAKETVQDRLRQASKQLKARLSATASAKILPVLAGKKLKSPSVSPRLLRKLEAIVALHPAVE